MSSKTSKTSKTSKSAEVLNLSTAGFRRDRSGHVTGTPGTWYIAVRLDDPNLPEAIERGSAEIPTRSGSAVVTIDSDSPFCDRFDRDGNMLTHDDGTPRRIWTRSGDGALVAMLNGERVKSNKSNDDTSDVRDSIPEALRGLV